LLPEIINHKGHEEHKEPEAKNFVPFVFFVVKTLNFIHTGREKKSAAGQRTVQRMFFRACSLPEIINHKGHEEH
jgi:hypothetical protein